MAESAEEGVMVAESDEFDLTRASQNMMLQFDSVSSINHNRKLTMEDKLNRTGKVMNSEQRPP